MHERREQAQHITIAGAQGAGADATALDGGSSGAGVGWTSAWRNGPGETTGGSCVRVEPYHSWQLTVRQVCKPSKLLLNKTRAMHVLEKKTTGGPKAD